MHQNTNGTYQVHLVLSPSIYSHLEISFVMKSIALYKIEITTSVIIIFNNLSQIIMIFRNAIVNILFYFSFVLQTMILTDLGRDCCGQTIPI